MECNAKYSFEMEYVLKCHSPIIHFQYNTAGATLRSTEVKPALDRFLVGKIGRENISDEWFVNGNRNTGALKYKMRIEPWGEQKTVDLGSRTPYDIYYGNVQKFAVPKKGIYGDAVVRIVCMDKGLREVIDKYIGEFFIVHNFGSMQIKGFGSYTVEGKDTGNIADILKGYCGAEKCFGFDGGNTPFVKIKNLYNVIRSGINNMGYQRSLLFLYMHERYEMGNEKAWLKQTGGAPSDVGPNSGKGENSSGHEAYFVRALLGLYDHAEYLNSLENRRDRTFIRVVNRGRRKRDTILRLASPIFFKIIDGRVYFLAKRINDAIYGAEFEFIKEVQISTYEREETPVGVIKVPTKEMLGEDFIDRFLDWCKEQFDGGVLENSELTKGIVIKEEA